MKAAIIIPARLASKRFPGKLLKFCGCKPLIQYTYEAARRSKVVHPHRVVIAAAPDMVQACRMLGLPYIATGAECANGTERCAEAVGRWLCDEVDTVVNWQADEPDVEAETVDRMLEEMHKQTVNQYSWCCPVMTLGTYCEDVDDNTPGRVRFTVWSAMKWKAKQFYRVERQAPVIEPEHTVYDHVGIYIYRRPALVAYALAPACEAEREHSLEQLRFEAIETPIHAFLTDPDPGAAHGINTQDDFEHWAAEQPSEH